MEQKFTALVTAWIDPQTRSMEQSTYQLRSLQTSWVKPRKKSQSTRGEIDDLTKMVADLKRQFRAEQRRRKQNEDKSMNGKNAHDTI